MGGNKIGNKGAVHLASWLRTARCLKVLVLRENNISDDGLMSISKAAGEAGCGEQPYVVGSGPLKPVAGFPTRRAIAVQKAGVEVLDVSRNRIQFRSQVELPTTLLSLILKDNKITESCYHKMIAAISSCKNLTTIDLRGTCSKFVDRGVFCWKELMDLVRQNQTDETMCTENESSKTATAEQCAGGAADGGRDEGRARGRPGRRGRSAGGNATEGGNGGIGGDVGRRDRGKKAEGGIGGSNGDDDGDGDGPGRGRRDQKQPANDQDSKRPYP